MTDVSKNRTKNLSSFRTLPLISEVEQALLAAKEQQKAQKKLCGRSYCKDYQEYICVDEMGQIVSPDYVTRVFPAVLMANNRKKIRFHDLRHPYVKHTTKKYNSEKQKTQATKIVDLIAWGFCFCIVSYSKRSWTL